MVFDLFKLHSKEDTPMGWIWVNFNPSSLKKEYIKILRNKSQNNIGKIISKKLNAGLSTTVKHLIKLKKAKENIWFPLPIIKELIKIINPKLKKRINNSIEFLMCKHDIYQNKVKTVKGLNINLVKFIGAHIADGYLQKNGSSYKIKISEGKEDSIKKLEEWIKTTFQIKPKFKFIKKQNCWLCQIRNKVIGRYLEKFFKIKPGKKFDIAKEPEIIKNSSKEIRKAFVLGVMTFDGGVKTNGIISVSSMSKILIDDIYEVLNSDNIKVNKLYNPKKKSWLIESKSGRNKKYLKKWLDYFEPGTWKYKRLKFFINNKKDYSINELNYLFPNHHLSKINLNDVYNSIKTIKSGKIKDILRELNKKFSISNTTIYKYLHILEKSNLISKVPEKVNDGKNYWSETIYNIK